MATTFETITNGKNSAGVNFLDARSQIKAQAGTSNMPKRWKTKAVPNTLCGSVKNGINIAMNSAHLRGSRVKVQRNINGERNTTNANSALGIGASRALVIGKYSSTPMG